jgi:hypothetical protein
MIISGAAPSGSAFLSLDCSQMAVAKITGSLELGSGDTFQVWGSASSSSAGGEPNLYPLGTLSGGDGSAVPFSPLLGLSWTRLVFERVSGASAGSIGVQGAAWGRAAPTSQAAPTAANAYSNPLDFSASGPCYLLQLDDAATAADRYQVWGTNDTRMRDPSKPTAGAVPLGTLQGGGRTPPMVVLGYDLVIARCLAHGAATALVAVETLNDGLTSLAPGGGGGSGNAGNFWQLGGNPNAPGLSVLGTTNQLATSDGLQLRVGGFPVLTSDGTAMDLEALSLLRVQTPQVLLLEGDTGIQFVVFVDPSTQTRARVFEITQGNATNNGPTADPVGAGTGQTGRFLFRELAANGTAVTGFRAPDQLGADVVYTLPTADGHPGDVLSTDGAGHLSWLRLG